MTPPIPEPVRELAAGYALGALSPAETRAFETAMRDSPELVREVADYRELNALLALRPGPQPDARLRQRLGERIGAGKVESIPAVRSRRTPWLELLAAAAVLLAAGLAFRIWALRERLDQTENALAASERQLARREATLNTLLSAQAELTIVQLKATGDNAPGIQFFWNRRANTAVAQAFRLPPAPKGKAYQLWVMQNGKPVPGPVFVPEPDGHALILTFALPAGGIQAAAVTVEPEGGSTTPTMPIVLFGQVAGI